MKAKVYSFSEWDKDGLIEVHIDQDLLANIIDMYEADIQRTIKDQQYDLGLELIKERKELFEKLGELLYGKSAD
jgi:hypothetical protein